MFDYLTLDGVTLHNPTSSAIAMVTKVSGLTGLSGARRTTFDRPEGDGVVEPTNAYMTSRVVVIEGVAWGTEPNPTIASAETNFGTIEAAVLRSLRAQKLLKWRVLGSSIDKQALVRTAGPCLAEQDRDSHGPYFAYMMTLEAADPLNYSQTSQSVATSAPAVAVTGMPLPVIFPIPFGVVGTGGSVVVTAGGTAPTWPVVTITGPISGPVIQNTTQNKSVYFEGLVLGTGESLVVDMNPASRSATVTGSSKMGSVRFADSQFWNLTPGVAETVAFYGLGLGYGAGTGMTVAWRDAYIN